MEAVTGSGQASPRLVAVGDSTGCDPACLLPVAIGVDDTDTAGDMLDALALAPFAAGTQPYASTARLGEVRPGTSLLPPGATVLRCAVEPDRDSCLAAGDGWTVRVVRWHGGGAEVSVTAVAEDMARTVLALAVRGAAVERPADAGAVSMGFWYRRPQGPHRVCRQMAAVPWASIRASYPPAAAAALDELMAVTPDTVHGRLVLLHGAPGTGKTTLLRTLAREWRTWCQADCVLDPEILFSDPGYLTDIAIGDDLDEANGPSWRLLLLEDCDELIRGEAGQSVGQALARLLNLTDGMLGQGRQVLVAITTNEDLRQLHGGCPRGAGLGGLRGLDDCCRGGRGWRRCRQHGRHDRHRSRHPRRGTRRTGAGRPWLMPTAVALVTAAFALTRRPVTAVPALLAGAVLYAGMYAQHSLPVMYASIAADYLAWAALALWAVRGSRSALLWHRPPKPPAAAGRTTHDVPAKG